MKMRTTSTIIHGRKIEQINTYLEKNGTEKRRKKMGFFLPQEGGQSLARGSVAGRQQRRWSKVVGVVEEIAYGARRRKKSRQG